MGGLRGRIAPAARRLPVLRRYPTTYVTAGVRGFRLRHDFATVRMFVVFVGQPRTGHSLVGALLDAHPRALIAHELDVLKYVAAGYDRKRLFALLVDAERRRVAAGHLSSTGYQYLIEGQWQARYERLEVIGDKKGGRSTMRLAEDPALLDRLQRAVGTELRVVQVVRNPYDVIATMHRRAPRRSLGATVELFFDLADTSAEVHRRVGADRFHQLRHEELIDRPEDTMRRLCSFVGLPAPADYLAACAAIVYDAPHRSRDTVAWTTELLDRIAERAGGHPSLRPYVETAAERPA